MNFAIASVRATAIVARKVANARHITATVVAAHKAVVIASLALKSAVKTAIAGRVNLVAANQTQ